MLIHTGMCTQSKFIERLVNTHTSNKRAKKKNDTAFIQQYQLDTHACKQVGEASVSQVNILTLCLIAMKFTTCYNQVDILHHGNAVHLQGWRLAAIHSFPKQAIRLEWAKAFGNRATYMHKMH